MKIALDVCDAVVSAINAGDYTDEIEAQRRVAPILEAEDVAEDGGLLVTITPGGITMEPASRGSDVYEIDVQIAVQKTTSTYESQDSAVVAVTTLLQEILAVLNRTKLTIGSNVAKWIGQEIVTLYDPVHLTQTQVVTTLATTTWQVYP